jgi:hypothetical protein
MKTLGWLMLGAVALVASLVVACGGDDKPVDSTGSASPPGAGGGLVARDKFLTYDGKRYELVNMLTESMAPESEFQAIGVATASDIDLRGDLRVYSRSGDSTSVFTHSAATADDAAMWLAWRLIG